MLRCDVCNSKPAQIYQRHTGLKLCLTCFRSSIVERATQELYKYVDRNERLLLAVSGGKDSLTMLDVLSSIHPVSKLVALTILEDIVGYDRSSEIEEVRKLCREHGVEHIVVSMKKYLGYSVTEFMEAQRMLKVRSPISACTFCGIARRRIVNSIARELGVDKVVTAHVLDDELQTYLINILRGDIVRLLQSHPLSTVHSSMIVKKVKPLRKVYEYETAIYAFFRGFRFQDIECPYISQRPTLRARLRPMLQELESRYPGFCLRLLEHLDRILEPLVREQNEKVRELPRCTLCGEPTAPGRKICKYCELVELIRKALASSTL